MNTQFDLIIIGAGPAGLSAAIYAERAALNAIVIEKEMISGGQVITTYEVDNYPGLRGISGMKLAEEFREHADALGAKFMTGEVVGVQKDGNLYSLDVVCDDKYMTLQAKAVILATGAKHRLLEVPGELELAGMGVSYCATCDGAFFRGRDVAVIGGGNVAVEDALFLARGCRKVYVIHRRDEFRAAKGLANQLSRFDNVEIVWNSVVETIQGEDSVESITLKNVKTQETSQIAVSGVFIAVGIHPTAEPFVTNLGLDVDEWGYIKAKEDCETNREGILVAGDVRTKALRQIVVAAADGANAVESAIKHIKTV